METEDQGLSYRRVGGFLELLHFDIRFPFWVLFIYGFFCVKELSYILKKSSFSISFGLYTVRTQINKSVAPNVKLVSFQ